jgi:uncharacterized protein with HEPN domain
MMTRCCGSPSQSSLRSLAKHVSHDLRESHPEVPWSAAARMRDRLVHHYFDINLDVLWSTVTNDLPRCWRLCQTILSVTASLRRPAINALNNE